MSREEAEKVFLDSSLVFFASGHIGYRWAPKVMYMVAAGKARFVTSGLFFQDLLDRMEYLGEREKAEILFRESRRLMRQVEDVIEQDFERSYELFKKYPMVSPRILVQVAMMLRLGLRKFCATFASGVESVKEVQRVNLMEKVGEVAEYCR